MATPTVIDSLVVELGLDPSRFSAGQRETLQQLRNLQQQSEAGAKEIESRTKRTSDLLLNFKREAVSILGLFYGGMGIKEFIGYVTNLDAATGRFAKTLGVTEQELSAWQGAIKSVGGTTESASAAIGGLNSEMVRFSLTGKTEMLGVLNQIGVGITKQNGQLKTATELYLDIAEAIQRQPDPRRAAGLLSLIPGMNADMINLLLKGRTAVQQYLDEAKKAGGTSEESSKGAQAFQKELSLLERAATNAGRAVLEYLYAPLGKVAGALRELIELSPTAAGALGGLAAIFGGGALLRRGARFLTRGGASAGAAAAGATGGAGSGAGTAAASGLWGRFVGSAAGFAAGTVAGAAGFYFGSTETANASEAEQPWHPVTNPGGKRPTDWTPELERRLVEEHRVSGAAARVASPGQMEEYIRRAAVARGIDPNIAVAVAKSEGLGEGKHVGDQGTSFGPFQLHYKNNIPGLSNAGLGDEFTKKTGMHASDRTTWAAQIDFALDEAKRRGWGQWHGWRGDKWAGIGATGVPSLVGAANAAPAPDGGKQVTVTTTIGAVNVNAPGARDADGIAREIGPALQREITVGAGNYGAQ